MHAETYARFLLELVTDEQELRRLFGAIDTIPTVKDKADWSLKWCSASKYSFATRIIAFAIVEGIFFSSSFAAIYWIRSRGLLPGLCHSNELITRDEGLHMDFACRMYSVLNERVPDVVVISMVSEAVLLEQRFFSGEHINILFVERRPISVVPPAALPKGLPGLNAMLMSQYVEYVADFLLEKLGYNTIFESKNPVS